VLAVSKPFKTGTDCSTLLVVRKAADDLGQMLTVPEEVAVCPDELVPTPVQVPITIRDEEPSSQSARSLRRAGSQSNSTGGTTVCIGAGAGAGTLSPRSEELEHTPPPSMTNGLAATRQGQVSNEFSQAVAFAVRGMRHETLDNSSSSDATPPMF